jgi:hypothetical protein
VPPAVVTVTATVPEPFGAVTSISVDDTTRSIVAATAPKRTAFGSMRLRPVIVRLVPAHMGALAGESLAIAGAGM